MPKKKLSFGDLLKFHFQAHKKAVLLFIGLFALLIVLITPTIAAAVLSEIQQRVLTKNLNIQNAIMNKDYATWSSLVTDENLKRVIGQANFNEYVAAYKLLQQGRVEEANVAKKNLGLKQSFEVAATKYQAIDAAIKSNDYTTWRGLVGPNAERFVTADNFAAYAAMYELILQGKLAEARVAKANIINPPLASAQPTLFYDSDDTNDDRFMEDMVNNGFRSIITFQELDIKDNQSNNTLLLARMNACGLGGDVVLPLFFDGAACFQGLEQVSGFFVDNKTNILFYTNKEEESQAVLNYIVAGGIRNIITFRELDVSSSEDNSALLNYKAGVCGVGVATPTFFDGTTCISGSRDIINYFKSKESAPSMILFFSGAIGEAYKVMEFIAAQNVRKLLQFQELDVDSNQDNIELLNQKAALCGVEKDLPFFFNGTDQCIVGDNPIIDFMNNLISGPATPEI